jgi:hypothetical protein
MPPNYSPKSSDRAEVHLLSWIICGFSLLLCTQYVLREWLATYTPPLAELVVGLLLLLVTVPSARIKRFQIAKFVVEFHADSSHRQR